METKSESGAEVSSNFIRHTPRDVSNYPVAVGPFYGKQLLPPKIVIELNVGPNDFVDGSRSYLSFKFKSNRNNNPAYTFGRGSAMNCIKSIQCYSSDGQVIDNLTGVNVFKATTDRWVKKTAFFSSGKGESIGYNSNISDAIYAIELNEIIPLFSAGLLPSNLVDGMRIEIELAPTHEAILTTALTGLAGLTYEIEDPKIHLNVKKMDHEFISDYTSKKQVLTFDTYKHQIKHFKKPSINIPLQYSVAMGKYILASVIPATENPQSPIAAEEDRLRTDYAAGGLYDDTEFRYRVGNLTIPERPADRIEGWELANSLFPDSDYVSLKDFNDGAGVLACDLTRDGYGTPIFNNNEVTLEYSEEKTVNPKLINMYCVYEKHLVLDPVTEEQKQMGYVNKLSILE